MNTTVNNIKQRLSLREPLAEALEVVAKLTDKLALKKPTSTEEYEPFLKEQLAQAQDVLLSHDTVDRTTMFAYLVASSVM